MDYVFSVRSVSKGAFTSEPGASHFLEVPGRATDLKPDHIIPKTKWVNKVIGLSKAGTHSGVSEGEIVVYVHGYNNDTKSVLRRLRDLRKGLKANGFDGVIVAFDWPSADMALNYLEDRMDAKNTAFRLVSEGIRSFAALQEPDCRINTHIVAHSMGCYVVREAFDDADDRPAIAAQSWSVSQIVFLGADVSARSMEEGRSKTSSLYRHCVRLTNYFNPFDYVLKVSNAKRIGVSRRAGRVGVASPEPSKLVDVNCGRYWDKHGNKITGKDDSPHNWYFADKQVLKDLAFTLKGDIDRDKIPTREHGDQGNLLLKLR
ncbi:MAG: alpha/beta hydrolase [Pseudomonadota bacterium]